MIKSAKLQSRQGLALILTWKWLELDLESWILKMIFENQLFKSSSSHFQVKIKASPCLDCNLADLIVTWLTWSQSSDFKSISSKIYVLLMRHLYQNHNVTHCVPLLLLQVMTIWLMWDWCGTRGTGQFRNMSKVHDTDLVWDKRDWGLLSTPGLQLYTH